MFGYIKPYKPNMRFIDWDVYKGIYCSLCRRMVKRFGILSGFLLSYDSAFLAIILLSLENKPFRLKSGRCAYNPFKRCGLYVGGDQILDFAGAASVILFYYKIEDDIRDSGFIRSLFMKTLSLLIRGTYKKAVRNYKDLENIIKSYSIFQEKVEKNKETSIDSSCDPTAEMVSAVLSLRVEETNQKRIMSSLGYFLGKWIYLADAADDLEKDINKGTFNPFLKKYNIKTKEDIESSGIYDYCNDAMNQAISQIIASYNLLDINKFRDILDNIINIGLCGVQRQIVEKKGRCENCEGSV